MPFEFYFPKTFYYRDALVSEEENRRLVEAALRLRDAHPASTRQNLYTTYGTVPNVLQQEAFDGLRKSLIHEIVCYLEQIETRDGYSCTIADSWISISSPGNYERMHVHDGSYVSGVYYLQTPSQCGRIVFENLGDNLWASTRARRENLSAVSFEPRERQVILFNSLVPHHVSQNLSSSDRIALSFNVALV